MQSASATLVLVVLLSLTLDAARARELQPIVYSSSGELCSVSSLANPPTCVEAVGEFRDPAWQPHGDRLAVEAGVHDGAYELELRDRQGSKIGQLEKWPGFIRPTWSRDGHHIYALSYELGAAVGRWDRDGQHFRVLPVSGVNGKQPYFQMLSFSPSGGRFALLNSKFDGFQIGRVSGEGFSVERALPTGFEYVAGSAWLDEESLLFVGKKQNGPSSLWTLHVDQGDVTPVDTPGLFLRDFLALSPDGKSVVLCATKVGEATSWSLWLYVFGAPSATRLTKGVEDVSPTWNN